MERRTAVYRAATREEAEAAYHDDALEAAGDGFVPTAENWATALGQQVLTVDYVFQPAQAPVVISALQHMKTWPGPVDMPTVATPPAAPPSVTATAPVAKSKSSLPGILALVALAVVAWVIVGGGNSDNSGSTTTAPAAAPAEKHLTGRFLRWEPVDESNGYAYFSVTNSGSTTETAECTIRVENDFGNFGFDILVGETVGPGETVSGRLPLSVGEGSFLINQGEVTNC